MSTILALHIAAFALVLLSLLPDMLRHGPGTCRHSRSASAALMMATAVAALKFPPGALSLGIAATLIFARAGLWWTQRRR